jgi:hypothetical protein
VLNITRSPRRHLKKGGTKLLKVPLFKGGTKLLKVPLFKGDLGGSSTIRRGNSDFSDILFEPIRKVDMRFETTDEHR